MHQTHLSGSYLSSNISTKHIRFGLNVGDAFDIFEEVQMKI